MSSVVSTVEEVANIAEAGVAEAEKVLPEWVKAIAGVRASMRGGSVDAVVHEVLTAVEDWINGRVDPPAPVEHGPGENVPSGATPQQQAQNEATDARITALETGLGKVSDDVSKILAAVTGKPAGA